MNPEQFAYWLQGVAESNGSRPPTTKQWRLIRKHLKTLFVEVAPKLPLKDKKLEEVVKTWVGGYDPNKRIC